MNHIHVYYVRTARVWRGAESADGLGSGDMIQFIWDVKPGRIIRVKEDKVIKEILGASKRVVKAYVALGMDRNV